MVSFSNGVLKTSPRAYFSRQRAEFLRNNEVMPEGVTKCLGGADPGPFIAELEVGEVRS